MIFPCCLLTIMRRTNSFVRGMEPLKLGKVTCTTGKNDETFRTRVTDNGILYKPATHMVKPSITLNNIL